HIAHNLWWFLTGRGVPAMADESNDSVVRFEQKVSLAEKKLQQLLSHPGILDAIAIRAGLLNPLRYVVERLADEITDHDDWFVELGRLHREHALSTAAPDLSSFNRTEFLNMVYVLVRFKLERRTFIKQVNQVTGLALLDGNIVSAAAKLFLPDDPQ